MQRNTKQVGLCLVLGVLISIPALAAGPIDGEVAALYWSNDIKTQTSQGTVSSEAAAPGIKAELWLKKKYGMRATQLTSEADDFGGGGADYTSVDLMWRAFAPSENNFLSVGLGWQQMDLSNIGFEGDTSGVRLSVEGRVGLVKQLFAYGQGAYLPSLDEVGSSNPLTVGYGEGSGMEYEFGVGWRVAPFISLQAGYRANQTDFDSGGGTPLASTNSSTGGNDSTGGTTTLAPNPVLPQGCQNCPGATLPGAGGSADSTGYFVGLGFRF